MAHVGVPAVARVVVDGVDADVPGATLRRGAADATGPLGEPRELTVDLVAGAPAVLTDLSPGLDPARMLQVDTERPGTITPTLTAGGTVLAERSVPTRVLAARQWSPEPPELALELLAAYVQPNHPAVAALPTGPAGGDPDEVVRAIVAAAAGIRYAAGPGRVLRDPGEVLDGRAGSALDVVLVLAAALERAGIRPLLWVLPAYARLGWWRE